MAVLIYAKGSAGTWYAVGAGESDPQNRLLGLTAGLDYSLWENVITRLEFRWDKDLTSQHANSTNPGPFGFDDRHNMFVALNVIYKF